MKPKSYAEAGVDIEKGDRFADFIAAYNSPAVSRGIGGFAGGIEIDVAKFPQPVLLSSTDGVGTKLIVARQLGMYNTLGIDLVAMCVNDLIVCGAEPNLFLDYIATSKIDEAQLQSIIRGVIEGCEQAECVLAGGETAEMPDVYGQGDFDLAGFACGIVNKPNQLPKKEKMAAGDPVYGIPSSGVHSNGLSLARKILPTDHNYYPKLLAPTRIYVKELKKLFAKLNLNGAAHITGGGLEANFERVLPAGLRARFTWDWQVPTIFATMAELGQIPTAEMRRVFNMGMGIAFTLPLSEEKMLLEQISTEAELSDIVKIGELVDG